MKTLANYKLKWPSMAPQCTLLMAIIATYTRACKGSHVPITYILALRTRSSVIIDELWAWLWTVVYWSLLIIFELVLMLAMTFAPSIHFWHNIILII